MIRITAYKNGFRRCGMAHASGPIDYADDRFSAEQLKELLAEPMLVVQVLADEVVEKAKSTTKAL
ncbi:HI1506-related protein [Methylobacter sp.]|uniref:HI1506-related protein n=1 Tax=Methylobacter sp. TaxID=2051955 RepID=UPI002486D11C|nr:HI1506-related protein [Methylobacter sp.]MDI1278068.1 HI1506-related protein [Methylobacter sp.]